jgi:hypothetical protein
MENYWDRKALGWMDTIIERYRDELLGWTDIGMNRPG